MHPVHVSNICAPLDKGADPCQDYDTDPQAQSEPGADDRDDRGVHTVADAHAEKMPLMKLNSSMPKVVDSRRVARAERCEGRQ